MFGLTDITYETVYIALSSCIAIIIWFEGIAIRATEGKLPSATLFHVGSMIDTIWLPISLGCLYYLDFQSAAIVVPISYTAYKIFGLFYGTNLMSENGMPETPEDIVIPLKLIDYTQSFSLIFFALCWLVIAFPTLPFKVPFTLPF